MRDDGRLDSLRQPRAQNAADAASLEERRYRILVVDDDEFVRSLAQAALRSSGMTVHVAADALSALWLMRAQPVDLLITDIAMPGCDGIELARRVREARPQTPILFITGGCVETGDIQARGSAPWTLLTKPFSPALLMEHVERLLLTTTTAGATMPPA